MNCSRSVSGSSAEIALQRSQRPRFYSVNAIQSRRFPLISLHFSPHPDQQSNLCTRTVQEAQERSAASGECRIVLIAITRCSHQFDLLVSLSSFTFQIYFRV